MRTMLKIAGFLTLVLVAAAGVGLSYLYLWKPARHSGAPHAGADRAREVLFQALADCDGCHSERDFTRAGGPVGADHGPAGNRGRAQYHSGYRRPALARGRTGRGSAPFGGRGPHGTRVVPDDALRGVSQNERCRCAGASGLHRYAAGDSQSVPATQNARASQPTHRSLWAFSTGFCAARFADFFCSGGFACGCSRAELKKPNALSPIVFRHCTRLCPLTLVKK